MFDGLVLPLITPDMKCSSTWHVLPSRETAV